MKKRFTRILGVGVTVAMLASMLVGAVPVSANVSSASVTSTSLIINQNATYTAIFSITSAISNAGADTISVAFPPGFDITNITTAVDADVQLAATSGIGTVAFPLTNVSSVAITGTVALGQTLTINIDGAGALNPQNAIGAGATVQVQIGTSAAQKVTNSPTVGDYVLKVSTSNETTAVDSGTFTLTAPVMLPLPGIVRGLNASDETLYQNVGNFINAALGTAGVVKVTLGPGSYDEGGVINVGAGQTLTSSDGAAVTIISDVNASGGGGEGSVNLAGALAVLDGLSVTGGVTYAANATVQNSTLSNAAGPALSVAAGTAALTPAVSSGNTISAAAGQTGLNVAAGQFGTSTGDTFTAAFTVAAGNGTAISNSGTLTVTGASISGASGIGVTSAITAATTTVTGSSFSGLDMAINVVDGTVNANTNTIDACGVASATAPRAAIYVALSGGTGVRITANTITNGPEDILEVDANANNVFVNFNTLTGNTGSFDNDVAQALDARNNWWGDASGPAVASQAVVGGSVLTSPWLIAQTTNPQVFLGVATTGAAATSAGVTVTDLGGAATIIATANYATNPTTGAPPADTKKFFDVYVSGPSGAGNIVINFFGISSAGARVYAWSATQSLWVLASNQVVDLFKGSVDVTIGTVGGLLTTPNIGNLAGLEFVITEPSVAALGAPAVLTPTFGDDETKLKPTFTWTAVAGATGYEFVLAEEIGQDDKFAIIDYSASTPTNGHVARETLKYSTVYNWRARAVRDSEKGPWVTSFFTTMAEPEPEPEPIPPVIIEPAPPAPPAPEITLTIPPGPPATEVIPESLLYVIIAVGAVLIIAVIILIVRTRRVA